MAKVTSKLQVTIPKAIAEHYGIEAGDEISFEVAGPVIRLVPARARSFRLSVDERLRLFDESTLEQHQRDAAASPPALAADRGWSREELYSRGRTG